MTNESDFVIDKNDPNIPNKDWPTIPEFFKGKSIFITGGTGFIGKVLIEKLLWSCPEVECIYMLLRPKKGKDTHQRLAEIEKIERLRNRDPDFFFKKVKIISGDMRELEMGISFEERQILINSVNIVYHAAASIRFDDPLKEAILMNTRGTREVMRLCQQIKNLSVMIHVSTTYCNTDNNPIYEKLYPAHQDWKEAIQIAETMDNQVLQILKPKYVSTLPNTYVFSKSLAEHVVNDLRGDIPTVIFRPSIVISTLSEPFPGWVENFAGITGFMVVIAKGVLRTVCTDPKVKADYMPVDILIKSMIVTTWRHGAKKKIEPVIPVYNCSSSNAQSITFDDLLKLSLNIMDIIPFNNSIWAPGLQITRYKLLHVFRLIFYQLLPALFVDLALIISKKKPMLFKIQRKMFVAIEALQYYVQNEFKLINDKALGLRSHILKADRDAFMYIFENLDESQFVKDSLLGARRYLLNEPDETLQQALIHHKRMKLFGKMVIVIFWSVMIWHLKNCTLLLNLFK